MHMETMLKVAVIITVYSPCDVFSQDCEPDDDAYLDIENAADESLVVLETLHNIGRRQCYRICNDVEFCHYVRYDIKHLTCDLIESDEYGSNFDDEYCDYYFLAPGNNVCVGYMQKTALHSGDIVCYEKEFRNIALHSSGYLSSTLDDYHFGYAVDGITTNDSAHARTNWEDFPYLVLDFERSVTVDRVEMFGIVDAPYFEPWARLHGVEVRVGMMDEWEFMEYCGYYEGPDPDLNKVDIYCVECLTGRYVVFKIVDSNQYLGGGSDAFIVKEVKVYGEFMV